MKRGKNRLSIIFLLTIFLVGVISAATNTGVYTGPSQLNLGTWNETFNGSEGNPGMILSAVSSPAQWSLGGFTSGTPTLIAPNTYNTQYTGGTLTLASGDWGDGFSVSGITATVVINAVARTSNITFSVPHNGFTVSVTANVIETSNNSIGHSGTVSSATLTITVAAGPAAVNLGTAGNFTILSESGISTTGTTSIVGDIGVSAIAATAITGFGLIMDSSNTFSTSSLVTGKAYAADYTAPTPAKMTTAISNMQTAYTDAAGRTLPDYTELGSGNIGGMTLTPGLYKWSSGVTIPMSVTLNCQGNANAVFIFQIAQTLTVSNGVAINLINGCQANNIFWQVTGATTLGTTSVFNGNILCATNIALQTGATLNGRALAQTAVTLDSNAITSPTPVSSTTSITTTTGVPRNVDTTGTNAGIILTTSSGLTGTVTVQQSSGDPFGGFNSDTGSISLGKFITINSTIPDSAISNAQIRIYYTDAELVASHITESSLRLYWYNDIAGTWQVVVDSGVNTTGNYVWGNTNHFSTYTLGGGSGPSVSINSPICGGYTNNATIVFYGSAYDSSGSNITNILYSTTTMPIPDNPTFDTPLFISNNVSFHTKSGNAILFPFTNGSNSLYIWATSNQTGPVTVCDFFVDNQTPNQVTNVLSNNYFGCVQNYTNVAPNFTWSPATDNGGSGINFYEFRVYNSTGLVYSDNTTSTNMTVNSPANGQGYYINVRAYDNAGNYGAWSSNSPTIFYDNQNPGATITGEDWTIWYNRNFNVSEVDTDNLGLFKCEIAITGDGTSPTSYFQVPCNQNYLVNITQYCPTDGANICWVRKRVTDNACNQNVSSGHKWDLDRTAPSISILYPANGMNTSNTGLNVNYTVNDSGVGVSSCWYSKDGLANISLPNCGTNITTATWSAGQHNVRVYVNDSLNNVNSSSVSFFVDLSAPSISILYPANGMNTSNTLLNVNYTVSDNIGIGSCWYSNDSYSVNTTLTNCGNITSVVWSEGTHNVRVYANDTSGNVNLASVTFTIDTTAPSITLYYPTSSQASNITDCAQAIVVTANDFGSGINDNSLRAELLNSTGTSVMNMSLTKYNDTTYQTLMDMQFPAGNYTLKVFASDNLGNQNIIQINETLLQSVLVDYVNPAICSVNPTAGGSCDFTFNICMRGADAVQFWMSPFGNNIAIVTPEMLGATISNGFNITNVGLSNGTDFSLPAGILQLSNNTINGRTSFNLHLSLSSNITQIIGPNTYNLQYYINSSLI